MRHSHLAHALANWLDVTGIAETEALNAGSNFRLGLLIRETRQPTVEFVGLLNLECSYPIGYKPSLSISHFSKFVDDHPC